MATMNSKASGFLLTDGVAVNIIVFFNFWLTGTHFKEVHILSGSYVFIIGWHGCL